jgi:hypothetical protein
MIAQWGTGRRIQDPNSGLKIFRRDVACAVVPWLPDGFSCSTSLVMAFLFCGYSVHYEPIQYRPRVGRSKFRPLQDSWNYLRTVLKFVHAFRPWRLYFPVAIAALLAALLVAGVAPAERRLAQPGFLLLCGVALAAIFLGFYQQRRACQNRVAVQTHVDAARRSA